ncbi:MAG: alcohol dehydrogenase catalytic domain-containing protein [Planctomycetota bacterium]|nr:alcohol dehydrogenase catalytic domain-containing protein [Planctomycetota bacterium]
MKALVMTAFHRVEVLERDYPKPEAGEVVVKVGATGICGSDMHGFHGRSPRRQPGLVLGHETHGAVAELGAGVDPALKGKRVSVNPLVSCGSCEMCRQGRHNVCLNWYLIGMDQVPGGMAEAFKVPAKNLIPLPDHVDEGEAVMIEPIANAVHLLSHAPAYHGMYPTAAIWGGGTLGVAILCVCKARGVRVLAMIEPNPRRAAVAKQLGAEHVLDPKSQDVVAEIRKLTGGRGVDIGLEAVGIPVTRQQTAASLVKGGTALLLGLDAPETTFDMTEAVRRELRFQCSYGFNMHDYHEAFNLVAGGTVKLKPWIDVVPLAEGQAAFDRLSKDPGDRVKIALKP